MYVCIQKLAITTINKKQDLLPYINCRNKPSEHKFLPFTTDTDVCWRFRYSDLFFCLIILCRG